MFWKICGRLSKSASTQLPASSSYNRYVLALAIALMVLCPGKQVIAETSPTIAEIRERYQVCRQLRSDEAGLQKLYGAYTDLEKQERPVWHQLPPAEGMVLSELKLYAPAAGQTAFAELMETTPSGDWSKATEYCFRADGSLAFIFPYFELSMAMSAWNIVCILTGKASRFAKSSGFLTWTVARDCLTANPILPSRRPDCS